MSGAKDENGVMPSYYESKGSNQRAMRPGQPVGRQITHLQSNPTREWVRRHAPAAKYDIESDNFFAGTSVIKSVGKDEGLSGVRCMAVVNENVWIGEREGCYSVWDFHSGDRIFRSTKKKDIFVWSILGPVCDKNVWVGSSDSFIRVFNGETMDLVKEMKEHVGGVYSMAQTPGGRLVFSGSSDFTIGKWDGQKMTRLATLNGHKNNVRSLIVVGNKLFSGSDDNTIKVWDVTTGALITTLEAHTGGVHALCFTSGKYLWSASEDKTIRVWDTDNDAYPCIKSLTQPHNGQINCLTLTGSLVWSSSWNVAYVWDPETFECKAQYKHHEGCINALLPVHQAVVSRVWSASNDGVINLWDTESTLRNTLNASSDGRLEEALLQLDEAKKDSETHKKKMSEMEKIAVKLQAEKDRAQLLLDTQKDRFEQQAREQRKMHQEAAQRNIELKDKLDQYGCAPAPKPSFSTAELLAAYELGLDPTSVMPADFEDDEFLDAAERERREKLREAFNKGRANAGTHDDTEEMLKRALSRAYYNGDASGAAVIQEFLDDKFPQWRANAARPVEPIEYLPEAEQGTFDAQRRSRLHNTWLDGLVDGSMDRAPVQPDVLPTSEDMDAWRGERDAFLRGKDLQDIFPTGVDSVEARRAYARGLGTRNKNIPEELAHSETASDEENAARFETLKAFLLGRHAASKIPAEFADDRSYPDAKREGLRKQREEFLRGLKHGAGALPAQYQDQTSDLSAESQERREQARNAFKKGQNTPALIPAEYQGAAGDDETVEALRTELRDSFLNGYGQGDLPASSEGKTEDFNEQVLEAYKQGYLAGAPFHVDTKRSEEDEEKLRAASLEKDALLKHIDDLGAESGGLKEKLQDFDALRKEMDDLRERLARAEEENQRLRDEAETRTDALRGERHDGEAKEEVREPSQPTVAVEEEEVENIPNEDIVADISSMSPVHTRDEADLAEHAVDGDADEAEEAAEATKELDEVVVEDEDYHSPDRIRKAVENLENALPDEVREDLLEACDAAEEEVASELEQIFQRAATRPDVRTAERERINTLLASKKDAEESAAAESGDDSANAANASPYSERLKRQARRMVDDRSTPEDLRLELERALGADEEVVEKLYDMVEDKTLDTAIPRETREALQDAVTPAKTSVVPDAVREVLKAGGLSDEADTALTEALRAYDAREEELAQAVKEQGIEPAGGKSFPESVRMTALNSTNSDERKALLRAYNTHEGRTAAVEDVARQYMSDLAVPTESRHKLRDALFNSGVSQNDVVADAVRFAIADEGVSDGVRGELHDGLQLFESRQGALCHAVREALQTRTDQELKDALEGCESRSLVHASVVAAESRGDVAEAHADALGALAAEAGSAHTALENVADAVANTDGTPRDVKEDLAQLAEASEERSANVIEKIRMHNSIQGAQEHIRADSKPTEVVARLRETLSDTNEELNDRERNIINDAIEEADEDFAVLRFVVRKHGLNRDVSEDARKQLRDSALESDSAAEVLVAETRSVLRDATVTPAARHALHEGSEISHQKFERLFNVAVNRAATAESDEKAALQDSVSKTAGKHREMYRVAREASKNEAVPAHVRKVLKEALGEDPATVTEAAERVLLEVESKEDREALAEALDAEESAAANLHDAVKDVLDTCDLSETQNGNLAEALRPVDESNAHLREVIEEDTTLEEDKKELFYGRLMDNVSEDVRAALLRAGIVPGAPLNDAIKADKEKKSHLEEVVRAAVESGRMDEEAEQKLRDALVRSESAHENLREVTEQVEADPLIELAERLIANERVARSRRQEIETALEGYKGRDAALAEELRFLGVSATDEASAQELLDNDDEDAAVDGHNAILVRDAIHRFHGKRDLLESVVTAAGHREESPSPVNDAADDEDAADADAAADAAASAEPSEEDLNELIESLGGYDAAKRLAESQAALHRLEADRLRKEQELEDLEKLISEKELEKEGATVEDERLRAAYHEGRHANYSTPLPEEYRATLSENDQDKAFREELTDSWLKGRQEAVGSVVPAEYAGVEGLSDAESERRSVRREQFLSGLSGPEAAAVSAEDDEEDALNATDKGRQQRSAELRRAGASDEEGGEAVKVFTEGVQGRDVEVEAEEEDERAVAHKMHGRGKWLREDVLGSHGDRDENIDLLAADKSRVAQLLDDLAAWEAACDPERFDEMGVPAATPAYVQALERALDEARGEIGGMQDAVGEQKRRLADKEKRLDDEVQKARDQLAKERTMEVDKLKEVLEQMERDLQAKGQVHTSLHNRIEKLSEQLGKSSAENEALTQELIKKASVGDVSELVTYYKERERKWAELSHLNRELQAENKTLMTESTALAHKLRALSFVFESRPTLVRSLYELHKLLSHVPQTLHQFSKHAKQRQLPRLEILDEIREVGSEVDTCKDGTRWIIANLFTSYELQHLGTSPQFFIPDGRRPTWRDIQVPMKQRELLLSTWEESGASPSKSENVMSPQKRRLQREVGGKAAARR